MTIAKKIWGNLLIGVFGLTILSVYCYINLEHFRAIQDDGISQMKSAEKATEASFVGAKAYQVIADAIINHNLEETPKDWAEIRKNFDDSILAIDAMTITAEERASAEKGKAAVKQLTKIFEGEVLPLLKSKDADSSWEAIRQLDDRMDEQKKIIFESFSKFTEYKKAEAMAADKLFDEVTGRALTLTIIISSTIALFSLLLGSRIIQSIIGPIDHTVLVMERLANNDTSVDLAGRDRTDELGAIARTVQVFKENAIAKIRMESELEENKRKSEAARREEMIRLAHDFEGQIAGVVNGVTSAAHEMEASAQTMSSLANQVSSQAGAVAAASDEASSNVETVAAATEELSNSVREISRQVSESTKISRDAVNAAQETDAIVRGLAEAVGKIGAVINLINDIASQTNLLALNATIEAARAGDAGKGFAVVANEVKNLANQTGKATEDISGQINAVQAETAKATGAISSITAIITKIDEIAGSIATSVQQQNEATHEIARNVEQAARGTQEVSSNISGVTIAAERSGDASQSVLSAAQRLNSQSDNLNQAVSSFVQRVRRDQ